MPKPKARAAARKGRTTKRPARTSWWGRLMRWLRPGKRQKPLKALLSEGAGEKRTLAQWRELRRSTTAEVKAFLAEQKPALAIKKLTRALLEDPQHPAYHELLNKAAQQKRQRRLQAGRRDRWADLPKDLKQEAMQLEAFSAYVDELEQLFDQAGIPPLSAPPPADQRQGKAEKKARGHQRRKTSA